MPNFEHNLRLAAWIAVILWTCFASGQTVILPTSVDVTTETVRLSDLLPRGAPDDLQRLAREIKLGRTPLLGSVRVYQGAWLNEVLSRYPEPAKRITVPDQVTVRRAGFPISRATIHEAIVGFLRERGQPDLLYPALRWSDGITTTAHPVIEVRAANWESARRQLQFRLRCVPNETCRDFLVYMQNPPATLVHGIEKFSGSNQGAHIRTDSPVLIEAGRKARLLIQADGLQISLNVICLERGRAGQKIRVRTAGKGHVFQAEVVNRDLLWSGPES